VLLSLLCLDERLGRPLFATPQAKEAPQTKLKKELQLSGDLMQFAVENKQTPQEVKEKQKLLSLFLEIARNSTRTLKALQNRTASISMLPFGSCVTGCGARGADVDACVFFEDAAPPDRNVLRRVQKWVSKGRYAKSEFIPSWGIPLLKVVRRGVDLDLSCNNVIPVFNTFLLRSYVEIMPELAVLAMAVKCWAKRQEVGSVLDGGLSFLRFADRLLPASLPWASIAAQGVNDPNGEVLGLLGEEGE
ncbi:Poly(A) RNA polymerase GLD2 (PAP-associated domain-containing protein 4), partial [Durusdinium trenchii]